MATGTHAQIPRKMGDQFYLCAHDHRGRPRLTPRAIELGAASAVFGDLIIDDYLAVVDDRARLLDRGWDRLRHHRAHQPPTIVRWLLEKVASSPTVILRDWITHIAPDAPQWIAARLEVDGVVRRVQPHWFEVWRTAARYEPLDLNEPHKLGDHLGLALRGRSTLTVVDVVLAGLLQATQLHRACIAGLPDLDDVIDRRIRALIGSAHPVTRVRDASLSALLIRTRQLVDTAVLAQTL